MAARGSRILPRRVNVRQASAISRIRHPQPVSAPESRVALLRLTGDGIFQRVYRSADNCQRPYREFVLAMVAIFSERHIIVSRNDRHDGGDMSDILARLIASRTFDAR